MAVRTKADLEAILGQLLADNTTGDISAADVRTVLQDMLDSLAFTAGLVTDINGLLGGTSWQTGGGGMGMGVSLQTVLDAIRADGTVQGIELVKDTSVADQITLRIQQVTVGAHGRFAAIVDNQDEDPSDFTAAIFQGGVQSTSDTFATPSYAGSNTFATLGFATPNRLTGIMEQGNTLAGNVRNTFNPAVGDPDVIITIPGFGAHYVYAGLINTAAAGNVYVLTEETP